MGNKAAIYSDDPEAISKIVSKISSLQDRQQRMKSTNAIIRKHKTEESQIAALVDAGYKPASAAALVKPDFLGRVGYPDYELTNNNSNIRRLKKRLVALGAA